MKRFSFLWLAFLLFACGTGNGSSGPRLVSVYATEAAAPWLADLHACSADLPVVLRVSTTSPDIILRLADPDETAASAYQVGTEDILIAANALGPLQSLTLEQARQIFGGHGDSALQAWAYATTVDVQRSFDLAVLNGGNVTSFARLAVNPAHMSEALSADVNAIGILPRRWMREGLRELLVVASVPVLAVTASAPEGVIGDLIACLQKE